MQIPVVDLSESDAACASIVRTACDSCGFFHVVNHGVDDNLAFDVIRWGATFFDRPWDDKMALVRGDMRVSRGYEISPEHIEALDRDVTRKGELAAREPSAARRIISERFSVGPFDVPNDSYHTDEDGALFFHPNAWPEDCVPSLRPAMEAYYREMESLCARLHRVLALAMGAPALGAAVLGAGVDGFGFSRVAVWTGGVGIVLVIALYARRSRVLAGSSP